MQRLTSAGSHFCFSGQRNTKRRGYQWSSKARSVWGQNTLVRVDWQKLEPQKEGYIQSIGEDIVCVGDTTQDREEGKHCKHCGFSLPHAIHQFLSMVPMDQPTQLKKKKKKREGEEKEESKVNMEIRVGKKQEPKRNQERRKHSAQHSILILRTKLSFLHNKSCQPLIKAPKIMEALFQISKIMEHVKKGEKNPMKYM